MFFDEIAQNQLETLRRESRYRTLDLPQGLPFSGNDYLGLSPHPEIIEAGEWALRVAGAGSTGSRLLGGNRALYHETEEKIAAFFGAPAALIFSSGYLANLGAVTVLGSLCERVISDEKIHASLIDGIQLSRKPKTIIPHNEWGKATETQRSLFIAESLYSMDGDLVDTRALQGALNDTASYLLLDEAHAAGVFREDGKGYLIPDLDWSRSAATVTFGKAFGVAGAAILCSVAVRELLINTARSFIYTTAPPPVVVAMIGASLDVVEKEGWRREELWSRGEEVRSILDKIRPPEEGADLKWQGRGPILACLMPGEDRALRFSKSMQDSGVNVRAIRYPTVKKGEERIRLSLSLLVSRENTQLMARELVRRWTEFS